MNTKWATTPFSAITMKMARKFRYLVGGEWQRSPKPSFPRKRESRRGGGLRLRKIHSKRYSWMLALAVALACCLVGNSALAAPEAELWPRWQKHDPASTRTVDHSPWLAFLGKYVAAEHPSGVNRLRYGDVTKTDKGALDGYIARLEKLPISDYGRNAQKAYWINLYNALTVKVVLDHFPVKSIKDISLSSGLFGGLFGGGPWTAKLATVEGEKVSLDDIEHRILRPIWRDNRVHYAVNCASIGCPNLQAEPFTATRTWNGSWTGAPGSTSTTPGGLRSRTDGSGCRASMTGFRPISAAEQRPLCSTCGNTRDRRCGNDWTDMTAASTITTTGA